MVGLELVGLLASPVIKIVLEKAQKYLGDNYKWQKGSQKMVEELTQSLLLCQATIEKVDEGAIINNSPLAHLLGMMRDTVYTAEDVLDSIQTKSIKDEVEGKTKNQVSKLACYSLSAVRNMVLSNNHHKSLKEVVDKLKELSTKIQTFLATPNTNIKNKESQTREYTNPRDTISQPLEERLFGRKEELDLILEIILGSQSNSILETNLGSQSKSSKKGEQDDNYPRIFVIPIVGMGGVGKTALAQAVYNHPEVQIFFANRARRQLAWTSISNNRALSLVLGKIYESFTGNPLSDLANRSLESISENLIRIIKGVKFLIVLDDMFDDTLDPQWDFVHNILSNGAPGSVVLITTQDQIFANRVARNKGAVGPIALGALDSREFWELFEHFAFREVAMSKEKKEILNAIGKKIADKLHGLPLSAKIIGNVLNSKIDEDKWRDISQSDWWNIDAAESKILPSIRLGYEQLNSRLRQCFAYCSLFPRNSLIEKNRLVHMWIAHNFIPSDVNGGKRLEDIGWEWFDELVRMSFFQRAWDNNSYVMHELMHDLAVSVSAGECFYLGEGVVQIPSVVRHLAVDTKDIAVIRGIQKHKKLRSLLYFVRSHVEEMHSAIQDILCHLNSIRVLDLSYMHMECKDKPPSAIWHLQHLRFLDLSFTGIGSLYHSSINLYHLQALYIRECKFKELPLGINKLINLRHLCVDEKTIAQISGIGKLTNLQQLGVFFVGKKEGHRIAELRNLREIRGTLTINNFENIKNKDEAMQAKLVDKERLDSIHIIASHTRREPDEDDKEILQELQPNKNIKDLRIERYAGLDFPNWIIQIGGIFLKLNTLCLVSFVNVKVLPPLGELPLLKRLQIKWFDSMEIIDSHLYGKKQTVFPLLEELVLDRLFNCEEWTDAGAREFFPRLSKLTIRNSRNLKEAPLNLFSSTLKELKIHDCSRLTSIGNSIPSLSSITQLELYYFSASISLDPLNMPLLEDLNLKYCDELKIEGDLQSLTHLKHLRLVGCSKLFSQYSTRDQQKGKGLQVHQDAGLRSLTHIEADYSLGRHEYHLILGSLSSLRVLKFSETTQFTNNQNLWFGKLTALKEITFSSCEFEHLPASLTQLSALKKMALNQCSRLESLTDCMPPNLQELHLTDCSRNLVQLCKAYEGQDQQFISSILVIHIDDTNRKDAVPTDASNMKSMELRKPQISDAIGLQACASCSKIFELSDLVLCSWTETPQHELRLS